MSCLIRFAGRFRTCSETPILSPASQRAVRYGRVVLANVMAVRMVDVIRPKSDRL